MKKIILSLVLITGYDAMEGIQTDRVDSAVQTQESNFTEIPQNLVEIPPQQNEATKSPQDLYDEQLAKIHREASEFMEVYFDLIAILDTWPNRMKNLNFEESKSFPRMTKRIWYEQQRNLDHLKHYINLFGKERQINVAQRDLQETWDHAIRLIERYTAIANRVGDMPLKEREVIMPEMFGFIGYGEISEQWQSTILFGNKLVELNWMKQKLMTAAEHISWIAEEFEIRQSKSKDETEPGAACGAACVSDVDSDCESDSESDPMRNPKRLFNSIKDGVTGLEENLRKRMKALRDRQDKQGSMEEISLWIGRVKKRLGIIDFSVNEFITSFYKNPSEWSRNEQILYLINRAATFSDSTDDTWENVDADNQMLGFMPTKYTKVDRAAVLYNILLHSMAKRFPDTVVNTSLIDEDTKIRYQYQGFAVDSKQREKQESKCTIFGNTGSGYDTQSITVKCDNTNVKSALAKIGPHMHEILVMQIYWQINTPTMVLSGISRRNDISSISKDVIGMLVDHLPNNESMSGKWLGGAQIQFNISRLRDEEIENTLEAITRYVKHAKSPIFMDNIKNEPELTSLFENGTLLLRMKGTHFFPAVDSESPWKHGEQIHRLLKGEELVDLVETIAKKGAEIIKLETSFEEASNLIWHKTFYKVKDLNILLCLQERIEHCNPNHSKHVMFYVTGMLFDVAAITPEFHKQLLKMGKYQCNLYVMRDENGAIKRIALTVVNIIVNVEEENSGLITAPSRFEMMQALVQKGRNLVSDSGFKWNDDDYVQATKTEDIDMIITELESNPKFIPNKDNLEHLKSSNNVGEFSCAIQ